MSNAVYPSFPSVNDRIEMTKIEIGDDLLDYLVELADIVDKISAASDYVKSVNDAIEDTYRGEASDEMKLFFGSLESHLNRLYMLYSKSMQYVQNTYEAMYKTDEQLINWILRHME